MVATPDHTVPNVMATVTGQPYLVDVVKMDACNHSTFSKSIIQSVTVAGISFVDMLLPLFQTVQPTVRSSS